MADQKAEFAIELQDETSGAAESAAGALEKLRTKIDGDTKALAGMQRALRNLKGATEPNVKQIGELQTKITAHKESLAQAQSQYLALGGAFNKTKGSGSSLRDRLAELSKHTRAAPADVKKAANEFEHFYLAASAVPGPVSTISTRLYAMRSLLSAGGLRLGVVGLTVALAALTAGLLAAVVALAKYGIAAADAARSEKLQLEGLTKLRNWFGFKPGNADKMQQAIDQVSMSVPIAREKLLQYNQELYRMGLRGNNLTAALEGVAIKASAQGDAAAHAFAGWAAGAALSGRSVRRLADDVKSRLGGIVDRQMSSLTVQAQKQHEAFQMLFGGLKIEGFLTALRSVRELFHQNTASGRALKQILEIVLQPLIDDTTSGLPLVKRFFQGMIIESQRLVIAVLQVRLWFKRTFADSTLFRAFDKQAASVRIGRAVLLGFAGVLSFVAGIVIAWAAPFLLAATAVGELISVGLELVQLFQEIDWPLLGKAIWTGIVDGLKSGASAVMGAVKDLGDQALGALKSALGISSPSKMFARLAIGIPQGVTLGIKTGAPQAQQAAANLLRPDALGVQTQSAAPPAQVTAPPAQQPRASAARGGGAGASVTIGEIHLHTQAERPAEFAEQFRRELEHVLMGLAIEIGTVTP